MKDSLLIRYLLNETEPRETQAVQAWIEADPKHEKYFKEFRWVWEKSKDLVHEIEVDEDAAWERFKVLREVAQVKTKPKFNQRFLYSSWVKIAASILLLGAIAVLVFSFLPHAGKALYSNVTIKSLQEVKQEVLLDGTLLTLNKHTEIAYSQKWLGKDRVVELVEGEAYFEVEKNTKKPFIITIDEVTVKVIGTSFNIRKTKEKTVVIVDEGVVQVNIGNEELLLTQDELATIFYNEESIQKDISNNKLFKYYVNKEFVARNLPLTELVKGLNEAYDSKIKITSKRAQGLSITTTLPYGSLKDNLEIISQTLGLNIYRNGDEISLE